MAGESGKVARPAAKKAAAAPVSTPEAVEVAPQGDAGAVPVETPVVEDSTAYVVRVEDGDNVEVSVPNDVDVSEVSDYLVLALEEKGIEKSKLLDFAKASDIEPAPGAVTPGAGGGNVPEVPADVDTDQGLDPAALARLANGDPDDEPVVEEAVAVPLHRSGREDVFDEDGERYLVTGSLFACWVDGNYRSADRGAIVTVSPLQAAKSIRNGNLVAVDDDGNVAELHEF